MFWDFPWGTVFHRTIRMIRTIFQYSSTTGTCETTFELLKKVAR
jgi:hypothetical protein